MVTPVHAPIVTELPCALQIDSSAAIATLALQHQGIGIAADFAVQAALDNGSLQQLLPHWELTDSYATRTAYALYMPSRHQPLKLRALIDHLVQAGQATN